MPTRARVAFARQALLDWQAQDYPNKELVIVDDKMQPSFRHGVDVPGVVYLTTDKMGSLTVGEKRNIACGYATGEYVCHWDDDDRHGPGRITDQMNRLEETGADITGYLPLTFVAENGDRWEYVSPNRSFPPGSGLCYQKDVWRRRPFQAKNVGEDLAFTVGLNAVVAPGGDHLVATIHSGNTSPRALKGCQWRKVA